MSVLERIADEALWNAFFLSKQQKQNLSHQEETAIREFITNKRYLVYHELIESGNFPTQLPKKSILNKKGTTKKRVVYTFSSEDNIILKFIAYQLYEYDDIFSRNCYAFRRYYGINHALTQLKHNQQFGHMYCYKADVHDYFNSIDVPLLLNKLTFLKKQDPELYQLFSRILLESRVMEQNRITTENHGAMAGTPIAPFFANVYLHDVDAYFLNEHIPYFRYSDDVLFFADTKEQLSRYIAVFETMLHERKLTINPAKVVITSPGEPWSFLGFSYDNGEIDLSIVTKEKIKGKIKRKANSLRRWQRLKGLPAEKAAIGFIHTMNRKFYGKDAEDEFTWNRWFFPHLTVSTGLHEIDEYMQEYIRYTITGRHYKGNYRITYEQMKAWGYRSLVNEYYRQEQYVP